MKKMLITIIVCLAVFLIYMGFRDDKIYYLSMGDYLANGTNVYGVKDYGYSEYVKDYLVEYHKLETFVNHAVDKNRIIDIINDIEDNVFIEVNSKSKTIQNALIKSDLITISIGMNDLMSNLSLGTDFSINDLYNKFEQILGDYEKLFKILREYSKEKIFVIGIYNTFENELDEFFNYADKKLNNLANNYKINYISIYKDFDDKANLDNNIIPNKLGHGIIADKIIDAIDIK